MVLHGPIWFSNRTQSFVRNNAALLLFPGTMDLKELRPKNKDPCIPDRKESVLMCHIASHHLIPDIPCQKLVSAFPDFLNIGILILHNLIVFRLEANVHALIIRIGKIGRNEFNEMFDRKALVSFIGPFIGIRRGRKKGGCIFSHP